MNKPEMLAFLFSWTTEHVIKNTQTLLKKYGSENFTNREKAKQTNLKRYGVTNPNKLKSVREKIDNSKEKKYGNKNFTNREKAK
mgnify:CR=1 FL=1